jgi:ArsR family transcriptional regulator
LIAFLKFHFYNWGLKGDAFLENEKNTYDILDPEGYEKALQKMPKEENIQALAEFYKVMGDPTRLKVLMALEEGEFCASDLASLAGMSRSAVSHQLKALRQASLVKSRKEGKTVFYSLDDEHVYSVLKVAYEHICEEHSEHD